MRVDIVKENAQQEADQAERTRKTRIRNHAARIFVHMIVRTRRPAEAARSAFEAAEAFDAEAEAR